MKVYLCGPINGCTDAEAMSWRERMKSDALLQSWRTVFIDPMSRDYRGKEAESYREIVELDKRDVRSVDVVLVNYSKPSVGTAMEIFYAWTLGTPVVLWCAPDANLSPWLRYHSTSIVHTAEAAVSKVLEICR